MKKTIILTAIAACLALTACAGAGFDPTSRDPFGSNRPDRGDKDADASVKN